MTNDSIFTKWSQGLSPFYRGVVNQINAEKDYVLEIGYGNSTILLKAMFGEHHLKVVDKSPHVEEHIDCIMDLCVPGIRTEETWDYIFCMDVLEHAQQPWILAENISAMLNPGGKIIVTVPTNLPRHQMKPVCDDYWRFFPGSLELLFPNLRSLKNDTVYDNDTLIGIMAIFQRTK